MSFPLFSPPALCRFGLLIGIYQSGIDDCDCGAECFASELYWLAEGLGLMPVLISGLCPFTFLGLSSLPLADMGAWWFSLMTVLSALIEMYWSQVLRAIYTAAWTHIQSTWRKQAASLLHVCATLHDSRTQLLPLMPYKEHGLYFEQGDRVTLVVRQTILQPENQRFSGPLPHCQSVLEQNNDLLPAQSCSSQMYAFMYVWLKRREKKIPVMYTPLVVWNVPKGFSK